jgi:hypothetical protein
MTGRLCLCLCLCLSASASLPLPLCLCLCSPLLLTPRPRARDCLLLLAMLPRDSYTATWTRRFPPPFATHASNITQQPSAYRAQRRSSSRPISHSMTPARLLPSAFRASSAADEGASQTLTWIKSKSWEPLHCSTVVQDKARASVMLNSLTQRKLSPSSSARQPWDPR